MASERKPDMVGEAGGEKVGGEREPASRKRRRLIFLKKFKVLHGAVQKKRGEGADCEEMMH